jgi:hypothetical protein
LSSRRANSVLEPQMTGVQRGRRPPSQGACKEHGMRKISIAGLARCNRMWDYEQGMRGSAIRQLVAAQSAPRVAAAFVERRIQIWDLDSSEQLSEFNSIFEFGGHRVALNPSGDICVAASWKKGKCGGVAAYDVLTGSLIWHRTDIRQAQFVRFSSGGDVVRCGVEVGRFQKLDAGTGATVDAVTGIKRFSTVLIQISCYSKLAIMGFGSKALTRYLFRTKLLLSWMSPSALTCSV